MENTRLNEAKKLLKEEQLSYILISDLVDVEYICGFHSSNAAILISRNKNLLFSDFRYEESARKFCLRNPQWKFVLIKEQLSISLCKIIPQGSLVGYQSNYLTVDTFTELRKRCKGVSFKGLSSRISGLFLRKYHSEIAAMRKAAGIGDAALGLLFKQIKPGMSEIEVARRLESLCLELGSEKPSFETIVLFGSRSALPHGRPGRKKLARGEFILIDFGCTVGGFCSDMTRTACAGKPSRRQRLIYDTVQMAQSRAINAARSGIEADRLDAEARSLIEKAGFGEEFGHALGHGVGLRVHELPRISPHVKTVLHEQTVITIEPGIYIPGFGGVRIEDMVVIGKKDVNILTGFTRELIEL